MASFKFRSNKAHRPPAYECSWLASLRALPTRVISPPTVECQRKHRSCKIVPIFRVALEDILDGKHLPPLSLKDFEEYLLFEERSAENLYFILWLREYTKRYRAWFATATMTSRSLALSFTRAKLTFFSHSSPHELNLASIFISNFLIAAEGQPHPHPSVFGQIQRDVEHMLQESLLRFVAARTKNAGQQRVWCALIGGIGTGLIALAPVLVSILGHKSRVLRLIALPLLWLGATIFLSSIHGICFVIYLLGDARQLYPFELARPPISPPRPANDHSPQHVPSSISGFTFGHAYTSSTSGNGNFGIKEKPHPIHAPPIESVPSPLTAADIHISSPFPPSPIRVPSTPPHVHHARNFSSSGTSVTSIPAIPPYSPAVSSPFDTAPFIAPWDPNVCNPGPTQDSKVGYDIQTTIPSTPAFNFDDLPGRRRVKHPRSSTSLNVSAEPVTVCSPFRHGRTRSTPFIAPLTRVWSPVITRAQWEIVMRSATFGLIFAAVVTGVVLAVPAHSSPGQPWYDQYRDLAGE
ncbi:F-box-like domain protein [Rhizoctonia solani AG-3 Rhs1AP]|uniref:F-box-like domain protein n=1 Tax=Rhizoctonia solani AG-3 Rhs1AP TaxID=1086054 RepID=X8JV91_9AGAM|nr:F-box-like domain protein [Rhizoctonia solani AG-3 Rhs1AP]